MEMKYDGYRILARVKHAWLDGEVVGLMPEDHISFQALQNAFDTRSDTNLVYYVFDLLYLDGYDLRQSHSSPGNTPWPHSYRARPTVRSGIATLSSVTPSGVRAGLSTGNGGDRVQAG